ncbi:MAG: hypothetical protein ACXAB7_01535 [Candidatus Kariarchaeaceae archaeon]|jgi:hypothetical protein
MVIKCDICGNPNVKTEFTKSGYTSLRYYCSKECNAKSKARGKVFTGISIIIIGFFLLLLSIPGLFISGIGIIIAGGILIYIGIQDSLFKITMWDEGSIVEEIQSTKENELTDSVYIEELQKEITICCYQTARLGERYCKCGRTVPKFTITK